VNIQPPVDLSFYALTFLLQEGERVSRAPVLRRKPWWLHRLVICSTPANCEYHELRLKSKRTGEKLSSWILRPNFTKSG